MTRQPLCDGLAFAEPASVLAFMARSSSSAFSKRSIRTRTA